jgi:hypothetical protein
MHADLPCRVILPIVLYSLVLEPGVEKQRSKLTSAADSQWCWVASWVPWVLSDKWPCMTVTRACEMQLEDWRRCWRCQQWEWHCCVCGGVCGK